MPADLSETSMFREAWEAGTVVRRFLRANAERLRDLADRLRREPPSVVVTCARGSSDHAATYAKYLIETRTGTPVASAAPSVASVYDSRPGAGSGGQMLIAVSQSGRSPDLLATVERHRRSGAHVVALVNDEASPLAGMADVLLPLCAGPERSVAATKSCLGAMAGLAAITAAWAEDTELTAAVATLPEALDTAFEADWASAVDRLADADSLFVVGRGYGLGVAQEAALKLKETCGLHAEAFSAAEVRHGPMAIVGRGFPVLAFATSDAAGDAVRDVVREFADRGATIMLADPLGVAGDLPAARSQPAIEPLLMLQSFYRLANTLSLRRGLDPDRPPHLSKVTRTL